MTSKQWDRLSVGFKHHLSTIIPISCTALTLSLGTLLTSTDALAKGQLKLVGVVDGTQAASTTDSTTVTTDGLLSYGGGLLVEFPMGGGKTGLEIGALYITRNSGVDGASTDSTTWIQVPVLFRYHRGVLTLGAGGYFATGFGERVQTGTVESTGALSDSMKTTDYGVTGALGFQIGRRWLLEGRYSMGLANLSLDSATTYTFTEAQVLLGFRF